MTDDDHTIPTGSKHDLRLVAYAAALHGTFGRMSQKDWNNLLDCALSLKFDDKQVVLGRVTTSKGIYIIADGKVRVEYIGGPDQDLTGSVVLARLKTGEAFGEMSFLEDMGASADVVADGTVEILYISGSKIRNLMADDSAFAARFYESL